MSKRSLTPDCTTPGLSSSLNLRSLWYTLAALSLGGIAQTALRSHAIWTGLLLYIFAALFFAWAAGRVSVDSRFFPPYRGFYAMWGLAVGPRRYVGIILIGVSIGLSLASWWLFSHTESLSDAWWLYGVSVAAFLAGVLLFTQSPTRGIPQSDSFSSSLHLLILVVIILSAAILRVWDLGTLPFGVWYDEASAGLHARQGLSEPNFKPAFVPDIHVSGHLLLLYSAGLRFVSDSVLGLRLISALFGIGGVIVASFWGRELRGPVFGLSMAFFMAVMRWDVNFSRIAMTGIDTPFFELLSLLYLTRLLRWGHLRDAAFAGLALGGGLCFYAAFRLFVLALGVVTLIGMIVWPQWWTHRRKGRWWARIGVRCGISVLAAWVVVMPLVHFALNNPNAFWSRVREVSIFTHRDTPRLGHALQANLTKHIAMFHVAGDRNGRHNLPGEPMLDPAMGVLFVFGLGLAICNPKQPSHLFFLILLPTALLGGILAVDFEAPQSLRSIAVLPAVAYLCSVPVLALMAIGKQVLSRSSRRWGLSTIGIAGAYILGANVHTYFVRQANDFTVWREFSTPETLAGKRMAELGPEYNFYVSPFLANHPSLFFLAPQAPEHFVLSLPDALPIRQETDRPAAIFLHPADSWVLQVARQIYPHATFASLSRTANEEPLLHLVMVSREDSASVQGLILRYWPGAERHPDQAPVHTSHVDTVQLDWTTAPVVPPFIAEWEGVMYTAQYDPYRFQLDTAAHGTLEIDGIPILANQRGGCVEQTLARGNHLFRLHIYAKSGQEQVRLTWQPPGQSEHLIPPKAFYRPPVTSHGLLGSYYISPDWQGSPAFQQIDPFLDTYFHLLPLSRPYAVEWTGQLEAPLTGLYRLGLRSVGKTQLFVNDQRILVADVPNQYTDVAASLTTGLHKVRVLYQDTLPRSEIHLLWTLPGEQTPQPIPARHLRSPPSRELSICKSLPRH
ncbi:MAG: PA14 domain-containing protein [Candidatus Binatia bacterium]